MLRAIRLTDLQISICSQWADPGDTVYLPLPFVVPYTALLESGEMSFPEVAFHPEYDFEVRLISGRAPLPGPSYQLQWPDGRYLQNDQVSVFDFLGTGMRARGLDPFEIVPRGQKCRLQLTNFSESEDPISLSLWFEGVLRVPLIPRA